MSYSFFLTIRPTTAKVGVGTPMRREQLAAFALHLCGRGTNAQLASYRVGVAYNDMLAGQWSHRADPMASIPAARAHLAVIRTWPGGVDSESPTPICEFCGR